jgi:hypothetical protein
VSEHHQNDSDSNSSSNTEHSNPTVETRTWQEQRLYGVDQPFSSSYDGQALAQLQSSWTGVRVPIRPHVLGKLWVGKDGRSILGWMFG